MLDIIGTKNCSRCSMVKTILDQKNIKYRYSLLDELSEEDITKYTDMARSMGYMSMPLIIRNEILITLQEV